MNGKSVVRPVLALILMSGLCAAQDSKPSAKPPATAGGRSAAKANATTPDSPSATANDARGAAKAQQPPAAPEDRSADRAAVRTAIDAFAKAFESRDPSAFAACWTGEGEYRNAEGLTIRGIGALEKAFTGFFAKTPEVSATLQPESLRFLSRDSAIEEGLVTIRRGPAQPATTAHYGALAVREGNGWRLAQLTESPADDRPSIEDLSWLIGQWQSKTGEGAEIRTTYTWDANKKFIHVQFAIQEASIALSGSQVIGVNPATGLMHSWTFEANGGVGEADWSRDGDHFVLSAAGTLPNGSNLTETNLLRRVNDDTFTWQSIDRRRDDSPLPDLAPVKVTRIKAEK
jgi:uncharacterized protein (TIGR02246 family)